MSTSGRKVTRREVLTGAAAVAGSALLGGGPIAAQETATPAPPVTSANPSAVPGTGTSATSVRSAFENPARTPVGVLSGSSLSPLHELTGAITPADLVFERHHSGIPAIDPARHQLLVHGRVSRELVFTLADLKRLPSVSRIHFLECSGNGRAAFRDPKPTMTPQQVDGLISNGEWTGVPLSLLLRETGMHSGASWIFAEGGDSAKLSRSIPIAKALDDAMIAYAFNGEPLRPAHGYPFRLFLPGYEGNTCVKWLRRIEVVNEPNMSRDETSKYTDPLANGTARQFSFVMDVKSTITRPAATRIARGWQEISGIAWSGRGHITRVDVSTDDGRSWTAAHLHEPALPMACTRFSLMWEWNGTPAALMSRAVDSSGATQPTRAAFVNARGPGTDYHFNHIRRWAVAGDGSVTFAGDG